MAMGMRFQHTTDTETNGIGRRRRMMRKLKREGVAMMMTGKGEGSQRRTNGRHLHTSSSSSSDQRRQKQLQQSGGSSLFVLSAWSLESGERKHGGTRKVWSRVGLHVNQTQLPCGVGKGLDLGLCVIIFQVANQRKLNMLAAKYFSSNSGLKSKYFKIGIKNFLDF